MEIVLRKTEKEFEFIANNGIADIPIIGAHAKTEGLIGFRPMEMLLTSLAGCMSIDILSILYKQKQSITNFSVKTIGQRSDGIPSVFENIALEISINGNVEERKIQRAIDLSVQKYCSVYHMLNPLTKITCKYILSNE